MAKREKTDLVQLGARVREPLRVALESAAASRGVSMNAEINERLMRSFEDEEKLETETDRVQLYSILRIIAAVMDHAGAAAAIISNMSTGAPRRWIDNPFAFDQATKAALYILDAFRPTGEIVGAPSSSIRMENVGNEFAAGTIDAILEEQPVIIGDVKITPRSHRDLGHLLDRLQKKDSL
jgi:hypothetical protein